MIKFERWEDFILTAILETASHNPEDYTSDYVLNGMPISFILHWIIMDGIM